MDDGIFYLTFTGPIEDAPIAQLTQLIENTINQESIKHLYFAINTPGGSVNAGIALYHYLRSLPIKVTTHNIGQVDSIGNMVFLSGENRIASPATSFLLHGVSMRIMGNAQLAKANIKEMLSQVEQDEARIETITSDRTSLTKAKLASFFKAGKSLSPTEAKKYGIVTSIQEFEVPDGAKRGVINTFPVPNQGNVANFVSP